MSTLRPFRVTDLFKFNRINLDPLTETYETRFYFHYLATWPEYFTVAEHATSGRLMGYVMGKSEGKKENWHGHVTAVTVAPTCRKLGLAGNLMKDLEAISDARNCRFVDLYVRQSNKPALKFYKNLDYYVHERIKNYYTSYTNENDNEDAYDMHKKLNGWKIRRKNDEPDSKLLDIVSKIKSEDNNEQVDINKTSPETTNNSPEAIGLKDTNSVSNSSKTKRKRNKKKK